MAWETMRLKPDCLELIDQRFLPEEIKFYRASCYREVIYGIKEMVVRGAPAIGAAAAHGMYLAAREYKNLEEKEFRKKMNESAQELAMARPTAVNLIWGIKRMEKVLKNNSMEPPKKIVELLLKEALLIAEEDIAINKEIGRVGNTLIPENARVLTHCNTGALATVGYGTALGVIRTAHESGKNIKVFVDETRPRLQGARLNAFELLEYDIPATLIVDSVAAVLIAKNEIDVIVVGADRIAGNGDAANKIGTFMLSELAKNYNVPFYIAAPISTIDPDINSGTDITIEERSSEEITHIGGKRIAPGGIDVYNPAFDVTPAENIWGIITERGIISNPNRVEIQRVLQKNKNKNP